MRKRSIKYNACNSFLVASFISGLVVKLAIRDGDEQQLKIYNELAQQLHGTAVGLLPLYPHGIRSMDSDSDAQLDAEGDICIVLF